MARLIKADGTECRMSPGNGKRFTLAELQAAVAGPIELMPGIRPHRILLNEEGKLRNMPVNKRATEIIHGLLFGQTLRYDVLIRGDVLILDKGEKM